MDANSHSTNCLTKLVDENSSICWTIENFTKRTKFTWFESSIFSSETGNLKWSLRIHPNGTNMPDLFLLLKSKQSNIETAEVMIRFKQTDGKWSEPKSVVITKKSSPFVEKITNFVENTTIFNNFIIDDRLALNVRVSACVDTCVFKNTPILFSENLQTVLLNKNSNSLLLMLQKKAFTDMIIVVEDTEIPAHQIILATGSPVFESMLVSDTLERSTKRIEIPDFNLETITELLNFIYTGKTPDFRNLELELILSILSAADKYAVQELLTSVVSHLLSNLNDINVIDVIMVADLHSVNTLKEEAIAFICKNKAKFPSFDKYKDLKQNPELMAEILSKICDL